MVIKSLAKLDKKTLRERIYEEVVRLIVSGELPSGGWVDEKLVIKRLRVSRTPFREAIGTLAKGGLIEIKPYRGFYVRSFFSQRNCGPIRAIQAASMFCGRTRGTAHERPRHPTV
jgi:DNA-binding GntR family transcriptional regulator